MFNQLFFFLVLFALRLQALEIAKEQVTTGRLGRIGNCFNFPGLVKKDNGDMAVSHTQNSRSERGKKGSKS